MTIGIIPCAGHATRLYGLPKYLLPLQDSYLLAIVVRRMQAAGVKRVYIGANGENAEFVRRYAPEGCSVYVVNSKTMSETILAAQRYVGDEDVLFAMPDTWWEGNLLSGISGTLQRGADPVVVGICAARPEQKYKVGMCAIDAAGYITGLVDKPAATAYTYLWAGIGWKAAFWDYIHADDLTIGYALQRALAAGVRLAASVTDGHYYDCGTIDEFAQCMRVTMERDNELN